MRCFECNKSEMVYTKITIDFNIEGVKVTITNVPAFVCPDCNENVIKADILKNIEEITNSIRIMLKTESPKPTEMIYDLVA